MNDGAGVSGPVSKEPGTPARLFVYSFALLSPLSALAAVMLPSALVVRYGKQAGGIVIATSCTLVYVVALAVAVRRVRVLAARFTPPLPLPGDIWNIGVASPPKRSSNWPLRLRFRHRTPPARSSPVPAVQRAAV